ncbi:MAG: DUF4846 domain-containing protein [Oscillospiraceae bacterium]|nr:DUF4846 domain-containing protein [Oscillospiraceae bacterium]
MKCAERSRKGGIIAVIVTVVLSVVLAAYAVLGKSWIFYDLSGAAPIERAVPNIIEGKSGVISSVGNCIADRFYPPEGYKRTEASAGSFAEYFREIKLKPYGSDLLFYDGKLSGTLHSAVFDFDVGNADLQQCADSIIRVYAEYYYSRGEFEKISFQLTNGEVVSYSDWINGKRLFAAGNFAKMVMAAPKGESYESFRKYLAAVMNYAGTKSLYAESVSISVGEFTVGDILINPGSPGHVVVAADEAVNEDGERCFLLAQGYMPAQEFHILVNPLHPDDPWYYESEMTGEIRTAPCTFNQNSIRRWRNFDE